MNPSIGKVMGCRGLKHLREGTRRPRRTNFVQSISSFPCQPPSIPLFGPRGQHLLYYSSGRTAPVSITICLVVVVVVVGSSGAPSQPPQPSYMPVTSRLSDATLQLYTGGSKSSCLAQMARSTPVVSRQPRVHYTMVVTQCYGSALLAQGHLT